MRTLRELRTEYHRRLLREMRAHEAMSERAYRYDDNLMAGRKLWSLVSDTYTDSTLRRKRAGTAISHQSFIARTERFVAEAFAGLAEVRAGCWQILSHRRENAPRIEHEYGYIQDVQKVLSEKPSLREELGGLLLTPDILVTRLAEPDWKLNLGQRSGPRDPELATATKLRRANVVDAPFLLRAVISCVLPTKSDRIQNTRTEALNLIRNRKGNTPHIVCVTFEPQPGRLASLALGTGDLDCMYHAALFELMEAIAESGRTDQADLIEQLVQGRRLRDITDLPMDLAV